MLLSDASDFFLQGKHNRFVRIRFEPIEGMTHSDICFGVFERKVTADMRRAFPENEGDVQETQTICVGLVKKLAGS